MKVAILQSNYLPWKGYFDLINNVDTFIFYDDVQFTKNDWRNRNKIKTPTGSNWISIPCGSNINRLVNEVKPMDNRWQRTHWQTITQNYRKAPFFNRYKNFFEDFYLNHTWNNLSVLNQHLIKQIAVDFLGITTTFDDSLKYDLDGKKGDRVMELLKKVNAKKYLSGPSAKNYIEEKNFKDEDIELEWMDYSSYPKYNQFFPPFEHYVSIIDLLFHEGEDATKKMLTFNK